jgi:hypothetical protein
MHARATGDVLHFFLKLYERFDGVLPILSYFVIFFGFTVILTFKKSISGMYPDIGIIEKSRKCNAYMYAQL